MRSFVITFLSLFIFNGVSGQSDCSVFFPFEKGVIMEYATYDKKGKLESTTENTVVLLRDTPGGGVEAEVTTVVRNKRGKEQYTGEYTVHCEDGVLKVDVTSMLNPGMLESFSGMEVSIEGDFVTLPNKLESGQDLPDASTSIAAGTNGISIINMEIEVKDRKVEDITSVTTPAGTYECYKISQSTEVDMMISRTFSSVEYYAKGVGVVRSETLNEDGEVMGYMELTKFEKP